MIKKKKKKINLKTKIKIKIKIKTKIKAKNPLTNFVQLQVKNLNRKKGLRVLEKLEKKKKM